jgi:hypothetical protein
MSRLDNRRLLIGLAWLNVAMHVLGLVLAVVGIRPGTPAFDLAARQDYVAAAPLLWVLGWATWMLCAFVQVAFYAALAARLPERAALAGFAVMLACAGLAVDWSCDVTYIAVLPSLAAMGPAATLLFQTVERLSQLGGLAVANTLYWLATLLLTLGLAGRPGVSRWAVGLGCLVAVFGAQMTAAGFTGVSWKMELATGPTIGCFCLWVLITAYQTLPLAPSGTDQRTSG